MVHQLVVVREFLPACFTLKMVPFMAVHVLPQEASLTEVFPADFATVRPPSHDLALPRAPFLGEAFPAQLMRERLGSSAGFHARRRFLLVRVAVQRVVDQPRVCEVASSAGLTGIRLQARVRFYVR